jgi:hypothetical protein
VKPAGTYLHFEGTYRGVYRGGKVTSHVGTHTFREMAWVWLEVTPVTRLASRNVTEERVLDFYFAPQLPGKAMFRMPGKEGTNVILVGPEKKAFAGTIYDVVMWQHTVGLSDAEITIKDPNGKPVALDAMEISGTIRFSIPDKTIVAPQPTLPNIPPTAQTTGTAFQPPAVNYTPPAQHAVDNPLTAASPTPAKPATPGKASGCAGNIGALIMALLLMKWLPVLGIILILGLIANAISSKTPAGVPTQGGKENFGCISTPLLLIGILTTLLAFTHAPRPIFYVLLFMTLCYLISRVQTKPVWRVLIGILFVLTLIGYWGNYFHFDWQKLFEPKKTEGRTRIEPPVPVEVSDRDGNKIIDSLFHHEMNWDDFEDRSYYERYGTTLGQYTQSSNMHRALSQVDAAGDVRTYWTSIYQALVTNDSNKLDSLANYFKEQRDSLHLNPTETAEAVVTFIQEIPYYLVHDGTCEEAANCGNDFMTEYHMEGKPCLGNMAAGIQGPYEFIHNLKGDCDTRSVLCYTILSKLGIPSSVWVSEVYGHSIIGIGVPASGNNFQNLNGQRHFATELTAKGFRVGMISPDHTDMDNWLITLKNQ